MPDSTNITNGEVNASFIIYGSRDDAKMFQSGLKGLIPIGQLEPEMGFVSNGRDPAYDNHHISLAYPEAKASESREVARQATVGFENLVVAMAEMNAARTEGKITILMDGVERLVEDVPADEIAEKWGDDFDDGDVLETLLVASEEVRFKCMEEAGLVSPSSAPGI